MDEQSIAIIKPLSTMVIPGATAHAATIAENKSTPKASFRLVGSIFPLISLLESNPVEKNIFV